MQEEDKIQELIDKYLLNKMSNEEKYHFEKEMTSDLDLQEKVKLQKMIINEIRRKEELYTIYKSVEEIHNEKVKTKRILLYRAFSIAALITGIAFIIWQPTQYSNNKIINKYSTDFPNQFSLEEPTNGLTRGFYIGFSGDFDANEKENLSLALQSYENQNYVQSAHYFQIIDSLLFRDPDLALYMSISQFKSGIDKVAIVNFKYLCTLENFRFQEQAQFFLSLAYIKSGKISEARRLLRKIKDGKSEYSLQATNILSKMRWF
jgi:hypothetical protein